MSKYDFIYMDKKYKWTKEDQGMFDCPCKNCQKFVANYVKEGILKIVQNNEADSNE